RLFNREVQNPFACIELPICNCMISYDSDIAQRNGLPALWSRLHPLILILLSLSVLLTCTRTVYEAERPPEDRTEASGYYDSRFPDRNISNEIEQIFGAVNRIQTTGYFYTYVMGPNQFLTRDELKGEPLNEISADVNYFNQSKSGTSVVLSATGQQVALLTANHVITFPDTIWHYIKSPDIEAETYVEAVTILDRQTNLMIGNRQVSEFEIIVRDPNRDVAILRADRQNDNILSLSNLDISPGNSNRLGWANAVFLLGYPKGTKMVTTGIISPSGSSEAGSFMIDAVFNPGFSGGLILANREGTGRFEWVGITTSSLADFETFLTPEDHYNNDFDPELPYTDNLYIRREPRINYGMTRTLSINEIRNFIDNNRNRIQESGLDLTDF
ncbi:MAG: serine protease, partial [Balneolaceae bacterium]